MTSRGKGASRKGEKMTIDERALKIALNLSRSLQAARIDYEATRSQLVASAKASAASIGIDPSTIGTYEQDSTRTMECVRHDPSRALID